jgi:mono/diheme cytochrome c family protein
MQRITLVPSVVAALLLPIFSTPAFSSGLVSHGRYLVDRVAMCGDCHTPRGPRGEFLPGKLLQGTSLDFAPVHPVPGWNSKSPRIAGLPKGWSKSDMIRFLETGLTPKEHRAHPPMPPYRMTPRDAVAVTLYLMKLAPRSTGMMTDRKSGNSSTNHKIR